MSITEAEVLAEVNLRLNRAESSIAIELRAVLKDLSIRGNFLFAIDTSQTLTSGSTTLSEPTDFKSLVDIVLNDGTYDGRPLEEISYAEYLRRMKDVSSASYSEPKYYAHWNNSFYLEPTSDDNDGSDYTAKIHHYRYHPESTSSVLFRDQFREAIYTGATWRMAAKRKLPSASKKEQEYYVEVNKLLPFQDDEVKTVKYRDV